MKTTGKRIVTVVLACLFSAAGSAVTVTLDASDVTDLEAWGQQAKELCEQWHPRLCHLLASKGFEPADRVRIVLVDSNRGIADTSGTRIRVYSGWVRQHPEDIGLVFHELVHVVQGYGSGGHSWLTEGIADYLRWAIFEGKPQDWFPLGNGERAYRQGYRVCGGFLLWLESDRAPGIVKKLNSALRGRTYDASLFEEETGLSLDELWTAYVEQRKQAVAIRDARWQMGPFVRPVQKPVIAPNPASVFDCPMTGTQVKWESSDTFNPAATVHDGQICVLYRAEDGTGEGIGGHTSRIGLARSDDGLVFERHPEPVLYPADDAARPYEWRGGCEDPRVVESPDGTYFMYYTMWNRDNPDGASRSARIGAASSRDLVNWKKHGPIFEEAYDGKFLDTWHKAASVVTREQDGRLKAVKINDTYWMYWGEDGIHAATSENLADWTPVVDAAGNPVTLIAPRGDKFDSLLTEAGPPAVVTGHGIVLFYNGKNSGADTSISKGAYAAGQLLLDAENPTRVLARCDDYFFKPELDFEKSGQYPDGTVFVEGLTFFKDKWYLYYGTADSYVGVAVCEN